MTVPSSQSSPESLPDRMSELLLAMVEKLVDDPESLHVETDTTDSATTFRLYVAPDDLGKVIGKQGRTARSLRTILSAIGSKANHRMQLDVLEDEDEDLEDDPDGSEPDSESDKTKA